MNKKELNQNVWLFCRNLSLIIFISSLISMVIIIKKVENPFIFTYIYSVFFLILLIILVLSLIILIVSHCKLKKIKGSVKNV